MTFCTVFTMSVFLFACDPRVSVIFVNVISMTVPISAYILDKKLYGVKLRTINDG